MDTKKIEYLTFNINKTIFGMDILDIQEATKVSNITTTPKASDFVEGIINLRGNIVTIVNTGVKLGLKPVERQKENHVLIIKADDEHVGLMIDGISTVIQSNTSDIEPAPSNMNEVQMDFFDGVLKTKDQLIGILRIEEVLAA